MKNKLIMHTKLHLQETFRCILQSSKMIRFTFCSRRLVTPSSRRVVQVCPCARVLLAALCGHGHGRSGGPASRAAWCALLAGSSGNRKLQVTRLARPRRKPEVCVGGAINAVCKGTPPLSLHLPCLV